MSGYDGGYYEQRSSDSDDIRRRVPRLTQPKARLETVIRELKARVAELEANLTPEQRGYELKTGEYFVCRFDKILTLSMDDHDRKCRRLAGG